MSTPKQAKELHQLKLKLTKDPRAVKIKLPSPINQNPPVNVETTSVSDQPRAPAAKVLKLSDVVIIPAKKAATHSASTTHIPIKPAPVNPSAKTPVATNVAQHQPATNPMTAVKSPRQHQVTLVNQASVVKLPRKSQSLLVNTQVLKQVKQKASLINPVVTKSPPKVHPASRARLTTEGGEGSTKHKPPPLSLNIVLKEPKQQPKQKAKMSSQSILPTSRVRTIMKTNIKSSSSDGPLNISQDSVAVIGKATVCLLCVLAL